MIAIGSTVNRLASGTNRRCVQRGTSTKLTQQGTRHCALVVRAVSQSEAPTSMEKLQHDLQAAHQQRDYWRNRCLEAEENLAKLKKKIGNEFAHGPSAPPKSAAPAPTEVDAHLGQKRYLLPEDDNKGRRDM